jgi:hypothetical protein
MVPILNHTFFILAEITSYNDKIYIYISYVLYWSIAISIKLKVLN